MTQQHEQQQQPSTRFYKHGDVPRSSGGGYGNQSVRSSGSSCHRSTSRPTTTTTTTTGKKDGSVASAVSTSTRRRRQRNHNNGNNVTVIVFGGGCKNAYLCLLLSMAFVSFLFSGSFYYASTTTTTITSTTTNHHLFNEEQWSAARYNNNSSSSSNTSSSSTTTRIASPTGKKEQQRLIVRQPLVPVSNNDASRMAPVQQEQQHSDVTTSATTKTTATTAIANTTTTKTKTLSPWKEEDREKESFLAMSSSSFGGCLKIMDDNHWLVEWLAYHWFVLPLRHLVVLVDHASQTSPLPIFDRWRDKMTIRVVDWNFTGAVPRGMKSTQVVVQHRGPQHLFYEHCMRLYKRQDWTSWIVLIDTDEFLSISDVVRTTRDANHTLYRGGPEEGHVPKQNEPGSVMTFLKQESDRGWTQDGYENTNSTTRFPDCLNVWRGQTCEIESTAREKAPFIPPGGKLRGKDFLTLQWLKRGGVRFPKNIVNIGTIDRTVFEELDLLENGNLHNVLPNHCKNHPGRVKSLLQVYHYDGTKEQQNFRNDIRGSYGNRQGGTKPQGEKCPGHSAHDVAPWLKGFVEYVGQEEASRLLEGVGRTHSWPPYNATEVAEAASFSSAIAAKS